MGQMFRDPLSWTLLPGAEDLKGSILKHRGELSRNNKEAGSVELAQNIDVLLQQAHHELKLGDPEVICHRVDICLL